MMYLRMHAKGGGLRNARGETLSGIGEFAYTILLGWMRALVDWFWSLSSGTGNTSIWQWFLANWKIWLLVLLIGGLVADWLTWIVRWRPYRVLLSKFRKDTTPQAAGNTPQWDNGEGYYDESDIDGGHAPTDFEDVTFATLSEIDPDWAGDVIIDDPTVPLYDPGYDPAYIGTLVQDHPVQETSIYQPQDEGAYWEEMPDEQPDVYTPAEQAQPAQAYDNVAYYDDEDETFEETVSGEIPLSHELSSAQAYEAPLPAYVSPMTDESPPEHAPFAPYDAYDLQEVPDMEHPQYPKDPTQRTAQPENEQEETLYYGRPGAWPGAQFPYMAQNPAQETPAVAQVPAPEPYDPLFNPNAPQQPQQETTDRPRRRRRRLRESPQMDWAPEDPIPSSTSAPLPSWVETPSMPPVNPYARQARQPVAPPPYEYTAPPPVQAQPRPERVITREEIEAAQQPQDQKRKWGRKHNSEPMTVTGKPAKRRGLMKFSTAHEEPILGLPPLELTNPFLPPVKPEDVDFEDDDGDFE